MLFVKLHGCISRINNPKCPLILSKDQYLAHKAGRSLLFGKFKELACQHPVLYVGYSLSDDDILAILNEIATEEIVRPPHYLVTPSVNSQDMRYWSKRHITAIPMTFDDFFVQLDAAIPAANRKSADALPIKESHHPICSKFVGAATLSKNTLQFLESEVDYVNALPPPFRVDPKMFYKGHNYGWSSIAQKLDARRHLGDTILFDHILDKDPDEKGINLVVIKAPAGAGKTVLLHRIAWDAANEFSALCIYLRENGIIYPSAISEICELTRQPLCVFIDNITDRRREVEQLFESAQSWNHNVTVIGGTRTNEWNQAPDSLTRLATEEHDLLHLSKLEIGRLLDLLTEHKALGTLEVKSRDEQEKMFDGLAGRQLLVALHEATLGKPFVEIVQDEYRRITPDRAKYIYLTICMLNQFGVPVRAGIIARRHDVPFEKFKEEFFGPLEQVVSSHMDPISKDMCYIARHPAIASMVVETILGDKEALFNEVVNTIQYLNPTYSSDRVAFQRLMSGRTVLSEFPDHQMASKLYEVAKQTVGDDAFLIQQHAIYEMNRPNGNLAYAEALLAKASDLARYSRSITHTQAELLIRKAQAARHKLERTKYMERAAGICRELSLRKIDHLPFYTLIKIGAMKINDAQEDADVHDTTIETIARDTEKIIEEAKQRFPYSAPILKAEADFCDSLSKGARAITALSKAFKLNPRNSHIAIRLARFEEDKGNVDEALVILRMAIDAKGNDQRLRYAIGKMMVEHDKGTIDERLYHLTRSYAPKDTNYGAQLLHAAQLFAAGQTIQSRDLFRRLQKSGLALEKRYEITYALKDEYRGFVQRIEATYIIISRDTDSESIYCPRHQFTDSQWEKISYGTRVKFSVGFNMYGPVAFNVYVEQKASE